MSNGRFLGKLHCVSGDGMAVVEEADAFLTIALYSTTYKPILRRLSSMTEEEMGEYVVMCLNPIQSEMDDPITVDEVSIDTDMPHGNGYYDAAISCRCFEGVVRIRENGDTFLFDEEQRPQELEGQARRTAWLLSKHFDLFGLIENEEALDSETLKQEGK